MTAGCDAATAAVLVEPLSSDEQLPVSPALDASASTLKILRFLIYDRNYFPFVRNYTTVFRELQECFENCLYDISEESKEYANQI